MRTSPTFSPTTVKEIDGEQVYGHMDYGKKDPSLGWRFTDAWLSMAGNGDKGLPNGSRSTNGASGWRTAVRVGSSVSRGGDANGPAAVYALTKFVEWLKKYAPPEASGMDFLEAGAVPGQGHIAQQIFWYSAFTARLSDAGPAGHERGRYAEVAHGAEPARRLLEGRHEARLPGRRAVGPAEIRADARRSRPAGSTRSSPYPRPSR